MMLFQADDAFAMPTTIFPAKTRKSSLMRTLSLDDKIRSLTITQGLFYKIPA
jgi:hypothetical protein